MKPQLKVTGKFKDGMKYVHFENIPLFVIQEEDVIIFYSPVFDISGYGKSEEEAEKSLNVAIEEFFKYTMNKKTLDSELVKLGWKKHRKKKYSPPVMSEMVQKHEFLSEIINDHDFRKQTMPVAIPA